MKNYIFLLFAFVFVTSCIDVDIFDDSDVIDYYDCEKGELLYKLSEWKIAEVDVLPTKELDYHLNFNLLGTNLFVVDDQLGVQVYDVSNLENPKPVAYYSIPGVSQLSIDCNTLFVDNFTDIISIDISDIQNPSVVDRIENVLSSYYVIDENGDIYNYGFCDFWYVDAELATSSSNSNGGAGVQGSLSKFTTDNGHLYLTTSYSLISIERINCNEFGQKSESYLDFYAETMYYFNGNIYIGSTTGMFVYSTGLNPEKVSEFLHDYACDPVYPTLGRAYVTLRTGTFCNNATDQLDIINTEDISNPTLVKTYPIQNPIGLSVSNNYLYLARGQFGLNVYDISDELNMKELIHFDEVYAQDVIVYGDILIAIGYDKLYFFDRSNPAMPILKSEL